MELLEQWDAYSIHSAYYISRHVNAALQRSIGLAPYFVNVGAWYDACPKPRRRIHYWPATRTGSSIMISSYFGSDTCSLCGRKCRANGSARAVVCQRCRQDPVSVSVAAFKVLGAVQKESQQLANACSHCNGFVENPSTFARTKTESGTSVGLNLGATGAGVGSRSKDSALSTTSTTKTSGVVTPLANCSCTDCPNTFQRHRLREREIEANAVCVALDLF